MPMPSLVRVRLTGVVPGDDNGRVSASVNAPNAADAIAALHRVAQIRGADRLVNVSSDYRRAALASGPLQTRWQIEVQASGTAMPRNPEAAPVEAYRNAAKDANATKDAKTGQDEAPPEAQPPSAD
ncbi:hypothetical protein ACG3SL_10200 [Sphingomonas sp. CJ20]